MKLKGKLKSTFAQVTLLDTIRKSKRGTTIFNDQYIKSPIISFKERKRKKKKNTEMNFLKMLKISFIRLKIMIIKANLIINLQ